MTFATAALFNQNLLDFIEFYQQLEKLNQDNLTQVWKTWAVENVKIQENSQQIRKGSRYP